jgi:hypothetical protein
MKDLIALESLEIRNYSQTDCVHCVLVRVKEVVIQPQKHCVLNQLVGRWIMSRIMIDY